MVDFDDSNSILRLIKKLEEEHIGEKERLETIKSRTDQQKALLSADKRYLENLEQEVTNINFGKKQNSSKLSTIPQENKPKTEDKELSFSSYGTYNIQDRLDLKFPNDNTVQITKDAKNGGYKYFRQSKAGPDGERQEIQKTLLFSPKEQQYLSIEVSPILPLNIPAKRTDLMMFEFENPVYLKEQSQAEIPMMLPVEVGIFTKRPPDEYPPKQQENTDTPKRKFSRQQKQDNGVKTDSDDAVSSVQLADVFSCSPEHSRFGLYGSPDNGNLCKYSKVSVEGHNSTTSETTAAKMKVLLKNQTNRGIDLDALVFYATNHNVYYSSTDVVADPLNVYVKHDVSRLVCELGAHDISQEMANQGWVKSPPLPSKTDTKFVIDKGLQ